MTKEDGETAKSAKKEVVIAKERSDCGNLKRREEKETTDGHG